MSEEQERARVVSAARGWLGTPYHPNGHVKGAGCDCMWLLAEAFREAGVVTASPPGSYSPDFMLHRGDETYLDTIASFAREYDWHELTPQPGDVLMWRFGRCFSHSAIVTAWPKIIHAYAPYGFVSEDDASLPSNLTLLGDAPRPMRAFSCWGR